MQVFPPTIEQKLGFDLLRSRIEALTLSRMGFDRLAAARPSSDVSWVRAELERVRELQEVLRFDDALPLSNVSDVRAILRRAAPEGAFVTPEDLLALRLILITIRRLRQYFETRTERYPRLGRLSRRLTSLPELEQLLGEVVDDGGRVRDDASPELRRLRRLIGQRQVQLRETLLRELRQAVREGYATEEQPTIRNGRMVIPIRAEAKRKVQGFVQDASATGQTVYIEPASCLDLNNEVRELEADERREVERVLRDATSAIRADLPDFREAVRALGMLDLLHAKARFSNELDAVPPRLEERPVVDIVAGRNPVLQILFSQSRSQAKIGGPSDSRSNASSTQAFTDVEGDRSSGRPAEIVPLGLQLGIDFRTLIITGPNAGGKTVAMKTVGLFALMLAYGIPLPADERTRFTVFERLLVDIGDEQSLEEDLSTFSSHVTNLKRMLRLADDRTLILIDEAGTGTDPAEGGALAEAVLTTLTQSGALTIATTHHGTLKVFAHETDGVENGSMEFDQETLGPTYRFRPGIPGSSYAFEIATRIGLDSSVLDLARTLVGEQKRALEDLISRFEARNQELDALGTEVEATLRQARSERERYEGRAEKLQREREEIRRQALEEARRIVDAANADVERTIREIKEANAEREATRAARERLEQVRDRIAERLAGSEKDEEIGPDRQAKADRRARKAARGPIQVGDQVVVDDGSTTAEVLEVHNDEAVLSFDSVRLRAKLDRLTKVAGKRKQQVKMGRVEHGGGLPVLSAATRIDVRGRRADEAIEAVQRFLDEAVSAGMNQVDILHGKGTGALRAAIQNYLSERGDVRSFEEAPIEHGGAGVTIVFLG